MPAARPPGVNGFTLNPGAGVNEGKLLVSPGGSANTITIQGARFDANSEVYVSDGRNDQFVGFPFSPTLPVAPDGQTINGSFTAIGPTPVVPKPVFGGSTTVTVTVVNTSNGIPMSGVSTQTAAT